MCRTFLTPALPQSANAVACYKKYPAFLKYGAGMMVNTLLLR